MTEPQNKKPILVLGRGVDGSLKTEIYLLSPGETFIGFDGNQTLVAGKEGTLVMRRIYADGMKIDNDLDIDSPRVWGHVQSLINKTEARQVLGLEDLTEADIAALEATRAPGAAKA